MPELRTSRLQLRPWCLDDWPLVQSLLKDAGFRRFSSFQPLSDQEAQAFVQQRYHLCQQNGGGLWLLWQASDLVGHVQLLPQRLDEPPQPQEEPCWELGYRLLKKYWGHGLAHEAADRVLKYAFRELQLPKVHAFIEPSNHPSVALIQKLGFKAGALGVFKGNPVNIWSKDNLFAALDCHYEGERVRTACLLVADVQAPTINRFLIRETQQVVDYLSGQFFRRELGPLLDCLEAFVETSGHPEVIFVDAHVDLGAKGPGLGRHLFEALEERSAVIGVAKNPYNIDGRPVNVPVLRGQSRRPLFVSAAGIPIENAVDIISKMPGPHRIPTLLRMADQFARNSDSSENSR